MAVIIICIDSILQTLSDNGTNFMTAEKELQNMFKSNSPSQEMQSDGSFLVRPTWRLLGASRQICENCFGLLCDHNTLVKKS